MLNEFVELIENKNKEVENMLVFVSNLEQIENGLIRLEFAAEEVACMHQAWLRRLEFAADEVACKHEAGAWNDVRQMKGEGPDVN